MGETSSARKKKPLAVGASNSTARSATLLKHVAADATRASPAVDEVTAVRRIKDPRRFPAQGQSHLGMPDCRGISVPEGKRIEAACGLRHIASGQKTGYEAI